MNSDIEVQIVSIENFRRDTQHYLEETMDGNKILVTEDGDPLFYVIEASIVDDTIENIQKLKNPKEYIANFSEAQLTLIKFKNKFNFFDNISDKDLAKICANIRILKLQKGEMVFEKGDLSSEIYFIINGTVEVSVNKAKGIKVLQKEEIFGGIQYIYKSPRQTNVVVSSNEATLLRFNIKAQTFSGDEAVYSQLYKNFAKDLSQKLLEVYG